MRLIDRRDIQDWGKRFDAKGSIPILISRLVSASTPKGTHSEFPSGSGVNIGGWDGIVKCRIPTSYVPEGVSLWEIGTEGSVTSKADEDYEKRSNDPIGYIQSESTFIFVTPNVWKDKVKWRNAKRKEGIWKDVLAFDSQNLEEWIESVPAVSRWFSVLIKKMPSDGIQVSEDFWRTWSMGPRGVLPPEALTAGRQQESNSLLDFVNGNPEIKAIRASSVDEAVVEISPKLTTSFRGKLTTNSYSTN